MKPWWHGWRLPKRGRWRLEWPQLNQRGQLDLGLLGQTVHKMLRLLLPQGLLLIPLMWGGLSLRTAASQITDPNGVTTGFWTRTLSASTGVGATTEAKITNIIARAVALGYLYVYVPASMFPYNASLVTFSSAITMLREGSMVDGVDVQAYGADPTQIADSTAAMQAAHSTGKIVYYGIGSYSCSAAVSVTSGGIIGDGQSKTYIVTTDTSAANVFNCVGAQGVSFVFSHFTMLGPGGKTLGAGIQIDPGGAIITDYVVVENVTFQTLPIGLDFIRADHWKAEFCNFVQCSVAGIRINNLANFDAGDNHISGCDFSSNVTSGDGILHIGSNGVRIWGCKFNKYSAGYRSAYTTAGQMSNLMIACCSFENQGTAGITLARASGALKYVNINLNGNHFGILPIGINVDSTGVYQEVNITGNVFSLPNSGKAIVLNNVTDFIVTGNTIGGNGNAGTVGVSATSCTTGKIRPNNYYAVITANVQLTTCTNVWGPEDSAAFTDAATIAIDMAAGATFEGILNVAGATRAVGTPLNPANGEALTLTFIQDGTGGRAVTWPAVFKQTWSDAGNTANKRSTISFWYDGGSWIQIGAQTAYA